MKADFPTFAEPYRKGNKLLEMQKKHTIYIYISILTNENQNLIN